MTRTVAQLAEWLQGTVEGDATGRIVALASLDDARPGDVSFLANLRYEHLMAHSRASAVLVKTAWTGSWSCSALIRVDNPDRSFRRRFQRG